MRHQSLLTRVFFVTNLYFSLISLSPNRRLEESRGRENQFGHHEYIPGSGKWTAKEVHNTGRQGEFSRRKRVGSRESIKSRYLRSRNLAKACAHSEGGNSDESRWFMFLNVSLLPLKRPTFWLLDNARDIPHVIITRITPRSRDVPGDAPSE
ncbi:UNVERIFIED_CONTAM: hypothetical protein PYX00_007337 [Menopon gallinae]|uniref:Secreted protein n=1 Tax=Menopon gallinae TaxID=328185 RepID=A0AAW2HIZ0_9NEOP